MRIFKLHNSLYKLNHFIAPEKKLSIYAKERYEKIQQWKKLKSYKLPDEEISRIVGLSRSNYYRYTRSIEIYGLNSLENKSRRPKTLRRSKISESTRVRILNIRRENSSYGKAKIAVILKRDFGIMLSESSVGRILKELYTKGQITRSVAYRHVRKRRKFTKHAKAWRYGMRAKNPGELVQIDHMSVTKHNVNMKEFRAIDPITKMMVAEVFSNANSSSAAKFLHKVIAALPYKIKSIQVDGGSEFMKDFETECKKLTIELFVLPPNRPQYNGAVERANRTIRDEFYAKNDINAESIRAFSHELQKAVRKYNAYRPHYSLQGLTPLEYTNSILVTQSQSHIY